MSHLTLLTRYPRRPLRLNRTSPPKVHGAKTPRKAPAPPKRPRSADWFPKTGLWANERALAGLLEGAVPPVTRCRSIEYCGAAVCAPGGFREAGLPGSPPSTRRQALRAAFTARAGFRPGTPGAISPRSRLPPSAHFFGPREGDAARVRSDGTGHGAEVASRLAV